MATWTYGGATEPLAISGRADDAYKASAFPGLGGLAAASTQLPELGQQGPGIPVTEAIWWRDFAFWARQEFIRRAKISSPGITSVAVAANNGAGDANGIGTLTIQIGTN